MYKTIITPENNSIQIELPEEYIGKQVEITAHVKSKLKTNSKLKSNKQARLQQLQELYKTYNYDLSNYKFNRDELNER